MMGSFKRLRISPAEVVALYLGGGRIIAAGDPRVHEQALELLAQAAD